MKDSQPIIIGVTGGSGSGKTSVSRAIFNNFPDHSIMMLEQDSYYKDQSHLSFEERLNIEDRRLRDLMDIKVYVDTDDDIRIIRRIKRDMEERGRTLDSVIEQYLTVVKPMYHQFIEPTKRYADIIVPEGGENHVAIDLINTKVDSILTKM